MLTTLAILLAAAVILVPLSRKLGLGSVLGYLVGGALIGPSGLGLVNDVQAIADVSELGVVMLLFLIGLEVRPRRLWVMRRAVFGLGSAQVAVTGAALALAIRAVGADWPAAAVLGAGIALSSTAIVLPMLTERDLLGNPPAAAASPCCCSRISPSCRWWRSCRCWPGWDCRMACRGWMSPRPWAPSPSS